MAVSPPDESVRQQARERSDALAKPLGALGRLEELGAWIAACQGTCPPRPIENVRAVILAGDHGVVSRGVSAYPAEVTPAMVRAFTSGRAAMNVLARQHGASVRVYDLAVDADLSDLGPEVTKHKVRRSSGSIDVEDALSTAEVAEALRAGWEIAAEEVAAGADLLVHGDMGIGNTTPSAALIAASLGLSAEQVTGTGTGLDEAGRRHKASVIEAALGRADSRVADPIDRLAALGSADLAAGVGFLAGAADARVPVLLDGVISVAAAVVCEDYAPGSMAWFAAGHRSTEPAQAYALDKLGLTPLLDLQLRLGEGSGAMAAVPLVRSAVGVLREMALLSDLVG
ncbi:nicotinate-nucleotide--dimethylbenzimidazole phosphoribosyltransferase [Enemella dayhoffiae]|uniref:Nicotinate-nucleotide--dimethylbenzimidazole phosphoribosyltransferase n=1 Tax=Enemella dayhoffiae TaxID=2016507 RepID=A0A255HBZ7_9ACTN|nr:nicotinate-nucleotide--dimethylbenzimidazole phosphoribosyltransferase [Enemella dayhoffiae]OYO25187.1 nicotinate-nucleotide--dimethylbenzimidazole phosphoribosyltransferase [Enemella dayhoffiae]